ncbi:Imm50 family immunity protein [Allokutzneria sp. NRRL B-24872]|uniref:Imm50 family immunity protein n=1 Tax=Allokutzneria sp. NRRL B-24872 TaxID=1137961 RepID=UPI000A3D4406|nr:Imm50 family immunity protein [Allokutzneria sp. NRRL B-24872]
MSWLDHVGERRKMVDKVYSAPPSLTDVDLFQVDVDREGPRIDMRFDLATFADNPLTEWVADGRNRIQLKLTFSFVRDLVIRGFGWENKASIDMHLHDHETLAVHVHGNTTDISFRCSRHLILQHLSAYIHAPNSTP